MPPRRIALMEAGAALRAPWSPVIAGDFVRHRHAEEDEAFLVLEGRIALDVRDATVERGRNDFPVVPRGVEHRPRSITDDALVLMFEPSTTLNTGTITTDRTVAHPERL